MRVFKYFFPLFTLFVLFADELFYSFLALTGHALESGLKSREAIVIALVAYSFFVFDVLNRRVSARNWKQLIALFVILVLYLLTGFLYPHNAFYDRYFSYLLTYGAISIPAGYVGMRLARDGCDDDLFKLLPWVIVPVVLVVFMAVRSSTLNNIILGRGEGDVFNYQNASYYLSFCYAYCFFYVFLMGKRRKVNLSKIKSLAMFLLMFVCAIGCILGGGRGAFVFIVVITVYLIWRSFRQNGNKSSGTILLLIIASLLMCFLAIQLNIFDSLGFNRVSANLTEDEYRMAFMKSAIEEFNKSPLFGHGIGSIWWTVGFYTHNILTDLLVETGIVGTLIMAYVFIRMTILLMKWSQNDDLDMFMLIIFLGALVNYTFSGYWIAATKFFLVFGYVFAKK